MGFCTKEKMEYESKVYTEIQVLKRKERDNLKKQFKFGDDLGNNLIFISANLKQSDIAYSCYNKETDTIEYISFDENALIEIAKENIK